MAAIAPTHAAKQEQPASESTLSPGAQKFLENVYIFGQDGSPTTPEGWTALRQAFLDNTIDESRAAEQRYLASVEETTMRGVPVFLATPRDAIEARQDTVQDPGAVAQ